ncbi:glycine cleavage system H protein [Batrachochytrium salamandrivorans]|nr:glycine cleavage system H protein [Batrachochytrium salamandrivorans]
MFALRSSARSAVRASARPASKRGFAVITRFSETHEYISIDDQTLIGTVGISDYAQSKLGDVVYIELPEQGKEIGKTEVFGSVESVKAASDVYLPVSGTVVEVNAKLEATPGLVNSSALSEGWFIKIKAKDIKEIDSLLDAKAYEKFCESEH